MSLGFGQSAPLWFAGSRAELGTCFSYDRRYQSQHLGGEQMWNETTLHRLSPNTRELLQHAHYTYTKGIATVQLPTLDSDLTRDASVRNFPKAAPKL